MIFKGTNLCDFCFEPVEDGKKCENCGLTHENYIADSRYLKPGTNLLGKYIIGRILGRGSFGATYLAYSCERDKAVAIKEYCPSGIADRAENEEKLVIISEDKRHIFDRGARQFFDEAKTILDFRMNKNIVSVYDIFFANDTVYYSMEYLEGDNLKDYIASKGGKLSEKEAITIMKCVCEALVSLHGKTILHGDISPNSIFMCNNADVKLIEFGKAKKFVKNEMLKYSLAVESGKIPSEHHTMEKRTPYKDIYGLGSAIFYAVTGKIKEKDSEFIFDESLNFSTHFINIIKKCLTSKAEEGYKSTIELLNDLTLSTDYEGRCGNCHEFIGEDAYCRYCGTKKGEGKFEPYHIPMSSMGIPALDCVHRYVHECKNCGTKFESYGIGKVANYCYKCGNAVTCKDITCEKDKHDYFAPASMNEEFLTVDGLNNKTQEENPIVLQGIPVYNPPKDFDPKDNFMPCVYGSPEQMSGVYGKKKAKKQKNWLFGLLLALGVSVCFVLLILILLNL